MTRKYIPCGHRVLVKPDSLFEVDSRFKKAIEAKILLPRQEQFLREEAAVEVGTVLGLGITAFKDFGDDPWCKVGDKVYFARYSGKRLPDPENVDDVTKWILILNDEDVIAIVEEV